MSPPSEDEAALFQRPAAQEIRSAWTHLFTDPLLSLANLKAIAAAGLGAPDDDGGITLRSVYWRFYLGLLPPPTSLDLFPPALATTRSAYDDLRARFLVAPDGRWAADCSGGEGYASSTSSSTAGDVPDGWDPLSLDGDSPWKTWFAHLDLRATIRQDVDRTFPDIQYFSLERVRKSLVTMLFLFSVLNPDVGYRQGMHELLAAAMLVVDRDSLNVPPVDQRPPARPIDAALDATLDRAYVEHDAFRLFQEIMRPAKAFYEWRAEEGPPTRSITGGPQAPILERCNHIQSQLLRRIDPQLWETLETEGVEPQIWAIRWIRLVLLRELPLNLALRMWDGMFAEDPSLGILDFVCVAMLLLIRNELIGADYTTLLTHLLHFPAPSDDYPFNPALILQQAHFLRNDISPAAGVEVVIQNQELLGVKASPPDKPSDGDIDTSNWRGGRGTPTRPNNKGRGANSGMSGIAQGWFERAQKAGIDKAIADFRNNLPDAAATAYSFLPSFSPTPPSRSNSPFSTIPSSSASLPPRVLPPLASTSASAESATVQTLLEAERQMAEMRLAMVTMGKAMDEWMDTIRDPASDEPSVAEAWTGLSRVRESLLDAPGRDVDDMVKDWAWINDLDSSRSRGSSVGPTPVVETAPLPPLPGAGSILDVPAVGASPSTMTTPKTPTRAAFSADNDTVLMETPKAPPRATMGAPVVPPGPLARAKSPPAAIATAARRASGPGSPVPVVSAAPKNAAVGSPQSPAPTTGVPPARPPSAGPTLYLSTRNDRPAATLPRTWQAPRTSSPAGGSGSGSGSGSGILAPAPAVPSSRSGGSGLRSPPLLGRAAGSASPARSGSGYASPGGSRLVPATPPVAAQSPQSPPARTTSASASRGLSGGGGEIQPRTATRGQEQEYPTSLTGAGDPLAGLGVGSMPPASRHERKWSAWRAGTPPAGGGGRPSSGSRSPGGGTTGGLEAVGVDPLGASGGT